MNKNKFFLVVAVIIVGVTLIYLGSLDQFFGKKETAPNPQVLPENIKLKNILVIDWRTSTGILRTFGSEFKEGMTAFDLLKEKTEEANINLETKMYDFGVLIEAIGGVKNGDDGKYWLYYVNGQMPAVAADKQTLKVGDKVEFKFEKSSF